MFYVFGKKDKILFGTPLRRHLEIRLIRLIYVVILTDVTILHESYMFVFVREITLGAYVRACVCADRAKVGSRYL